MLREEAYNVNKVMPICIRKSLVLRLSLKFQAVKMYGSMILFVLTTIKQSVSSMQCRLFAKGLLQNDVSKMSSDQLVAQSIVTVRGEMLPDAKKVS